MANDAKKQPIKFLFDQCQKSLSIFRGHGRDIDFAKSEQSYHFTSTDAEAAAVRLLFPLHRNIYRYRYIPESYSIVCIYVKWH